MNNVEISASTQNFSSNLLNIRKSEFFQAAATFKCKVANARRIFRDSDFFQIGRTNE